MKILSAGRTPGPAVRIIAPMLFCLFCPSVSPAQAVPGCGPAPVGATCGGAGPASLGNTSGTDQGAGNPINLITGNKYQREVDMEALPGELGLELVRHYNSLDRSNGSVGVGWRLSYDTELVVLRDTLQISQADGGRIVFNRDARHPAHCASDDPGNGSIEVLRAASGAARYVWRWPDGRRLVFDAAGKLEEIRGAQGGLLTLTRGLRGELLAVEDPLGRRLKFRYGMSGYTGITAVETPLGLVTYTHESAPGDTRFGNLTGVRLADGLTLRRYHYESRFQAGNPHALTGVSVERRDAGGALRESQRLSTYAYESTGRARWSMRGAGLDLVAVARSANTGSAAHPATSVLVNAQGEQTRYRFADVGGSFRLLDSTGPGCARCGPTNLRYAYDAAGRLRSVEDVDHSLARVPRAQYERDEFGRATRVRVPSVVPGQIHETHYVFDEAYPARLARIEETGYSPLGPIRRRIDYSYDAAGRILTQGSTAFRYDERGRLIERREHGSVTRYHYDALSRPVRVELADGRLARYEYDALGRMGVIDIAGQRERYGYDAAGRLAYLIRPNGEHLRYGYDAADRVTAITDAAGRRIELDRDARGELRGRRLIGPDGVVLQRRDEQVQAGVQDPEVTLDLWRRPVGLRGAGTGSGYEYDDFGRLARMRVAGAGDTLFEYDDEDRLITRIMPSGERTRYRYAADGSRIDKLTPEGTTRVEFGANRRPARVMYAEGQERLAYDGAARLTRHEWRFDGHAFTTSFRYTEDGRMLERTLPGGGTLKFSYRRLPHPNAGLLQSIRLTGPGIDAMLVDDLNAAGDSPARRRFRLLGNVPFERVSDVDGRLRYIGAKGLWSRDWAAEAGLMRTGARAALRKGFLTSSDGGDLGGTDGAVPQRDARSFEWDSELRLKGVRGSGGPVASYGYDAAGQRVRKTVFSRTGATTTRYLYEDDRLIAEIDDHDVVRAQYIWLDDQPVAMIRDGKVFGIVADHQYAPRAVFNAQGSVPVENATHLRASHQYWDEETGLLYNGRRYLDPVKARYLTPDPLGLAGGIDPFAFHGGSLQGIDLHGTQAQPALVENQSIASWSFEQKLAFIFSEAADQIKDHELADALRELVSPAALTTTAIIFTIWAGTQFTPYGWVADLALTGLGALMVGGAVWDVIQAVYAVGKGVTAGRCEGDLREAAGSFAASLTRASASVTAASLPLGAPRIASLLRTVFRRNLPAVRGASLRAAADEARFGIFNPGRGSYSGATANREWIQLQRTVRRSDAHPPWDPARSVVDTWLNPGEKVYVIQIRGVAPGGWATTKQYRSLQEARDELSLLEQFKQSDTDLVLQEYTVTSPIPVREGYAGPQVSGWPASETYVGEGQQIQFLVDLRGNAWRTYMSRTTTWEFSK
ncbi:MAG: RHS repeat protein [Proteobacteria bacterium]|nr:RHS repeat protein [Pseudomonadota bacterium]